LSDEEKKTPQTVMISNESPDAFETWK